MPNYPVYPMVWDTGVTTAATINYNVYGGGYANNYYTYKPYTYYKTLILSDEELAEIEAEEQIKKEAILKEQEELKIAPTAFIIYTRAYLTLDRVLYDDKDDAADMIKSLCIRHRISPLYFKIYEIYTKYHVENKLITEYVAFKAVKTETLPSKESLGL